MKAETGGDALLRMQALEDIGLVDASLQKRASACLDRENAVQRREDDVLLREQAQRASDAKVADLQAQIDELVHANEALVMATITASELKEAAQTARRQQDEFLAMLAHELRNPLSPIRTAVEVLARLQGKPIPTTLLDIVRRQVAHMARLLDDLLDISRITRGKVTLQRRPTAVAEFIQQAVETCLESLSRRNQRLTQTGAALNLFVDGDPVRLAQIISNLLQNATKYTQEGGSIAIDVQRRGPTVAITVSDNGSGISAQALPYVFDLFAQDERTLGRAQGGLGIGLTLVRRMAELHGGSVEAHSEGRGRGSQFLVTLPCSEGAQPAGDAAPEVSVLKPAAARILLVEDNADAGELLADFLRLEGHQVDLAADGPAALDLFVHVRPQVVLCDIGLPGMDGYEVMTRMRGHDHLPRPVLIALTGYSDLHKFVGTGDTGFDHHVVKPVNPQALLHLITSSLPAKDGMPSEPGSATRDISSAPGDPLG